MISIIVAHANNLAIGKNNKMPWHIPSDLKYFKAVTTGHTVIMGRRTFESLGRPLPGRKNVVVSSSMHASEGISVAGSFDEIVARYKDSPEEAFIIGGGKIYAQALPSCSKFYITEVDTEIKDADTYFPEYASYVAGMRKEAEDWRVDEKSGLRYRFVRYSAV